MTTYSVYEPSGDDTDIEARAERVAFVKEGFSWPAFFVPALLLIYHRMWIELAVFVAIFMVLPWAFGLDGQTERLFGWISFALIILFAFEANDLRGAALQRRGYRLAGVATGRDRHEAEHAFFKTWLPGAKRARAPQSPRKPQRDSDAPAGAGGDGEEVIGLFPRP
ncbi:MAG: DUF2628 domain-containing protein [Methyloceanibacter sp.]